MRAVHLSIVIPVYRDADRAIALIERLKQQTVPPSSTLEILVVDDGSADGTARKIDEAVGNNARVLRLHANGGRSAARNQGAQNTVGDIVMFMDCDCLPAQNDLLLQHLALWEKGVVASVGPVWGDGRGFWDRYQADASARRAKQYRAGNRYSGAGGNLMVARWAFDQCGGFDEGFRSYGFEDRALQIRLLELGRIAWSPNAVVRHMDAISLQSVSRKMREAGEHSAARFALNHPDAYRALGYASLDVRERPWLWLIAPLAKPLHHPLAGLGDWLLDRAWLPYGFKRFYVRVVTALSFLAGTSLAVHSST